MKESMSNVGLRSKDAKAKSRRAALRRLGLGAAALLAAPAILVLTGGMAEAGGTTRSGRLPNRTGSP